MYSSRSYPVHLQSKRRELSPESWTEDIQLAVLFTFEIGTLIRKLRTIEEDELIISVGFLSK